MAQFPLGVRYNNGGDSFNGDYTIIGNVMWWTNGVQGYGKNNGRQFHPQVQFFRLLSDRTNL